RLPHALSPGLCARGTLKSITPPLTRNLSRQPRRIRVAYLYVGAKFCRDGYHRCLPLAAPSVALPVAARHWPRRRGPPGQHAGAQLLLVSRGPDAPRVWVGHHAGGVPHGHRDWDPTGSAGESKQSPGVFGDCRAYTQPDSLWSHGVTAAL